jgi:GTP-binding protein
MIDRVEIIAKGGDGGSGCSSFRREKFEPRGGPDGGDGGRGGSVVLVGDRSVRTLREMGRRTVYRAERGQHGMGAGKHGRNGKDLTIRVPLGTEVRVVGVDGSLVKEGDLVSDGEKLAVARGGIGGWGNPRFATSVLRAPRIAQRGQVAEEKRLVLDLKLLADVGIVGLPNAGKSTLLGAMSAARPKVAAYPFTTLEAALGVVEYGYESFVVADIPGLIEGAHEGVGLGLDFLRHVERTRVILHLLDGSREDPLADMDSINRELREYGSGMETKRQVVVVNKVDLTEVTERAVEIGRRFEEKGLEVRFVSGASREGVSELILALAGALEGESVAGEVEEASPVVLRPLATGVTVEREGDKYRVEGERVVVFAEMMPTESEEGRAELWRRLGRWGVARALRRAGAKAGAHVRLGSVELEWPG